MKRLALTAIAAATPIAATLLAGTASAATYSVDELTSFTSPSGNIGCQIDVDMVRCDIREADWTPPPAPADCPLDYGQGVWINPYLAAGVAQLVCAGDTAIVDGAEVLGYGDAIVAGAMRCESGEAEIRCRDTDSGHGFALSRQSYRIF